MDCGPAALKCLLEGFGIRVSYGRLREACQTDVDGTSIDTLEEIARQLGLEAEQVMIPLDHLLLPEARVLPALVVIRLPSGVTHFVVAWRLQGPFVQVMDPATGRRWPTRQSFLAEIYVHEHPVPAAAWRDWAGSDSFLGPLRRRLSRVGLEENGLDRLIDGALADSGWRSLAALDASARAVEAILRSGGLGRGRESAGVLERFVARGREDTAEAALLPAEYWSVRPAPPGPEGEERLRMRGAVLVQVAARRGHEPAASAAPPATADTRTTAGPPTITGAPMPLSPELVAALEEPPTHPARELLRLLRADGLLAPTALLAALGLAAGGVVVEALLLRGLFDLGAELGLAGQRLGAMAVILAFAGALLLLELPTAGGLLRLGRRLETRLRSTFLEKIPRLGDRYFHSRLTSDMAERSHSVHQIRLLPDLGGWLARNTFELVLTAAGIAWLDPPSAPLALLAAAVSAGLPLLAQPFLTERDLRFRTHTGALSRFYLDALLGLVAVRAHGAERPVRREHESLLVEWARAGMGLQRAAVAAEGLQFLAGFGLAAWLLLSHLGRAGETGSVLLLAYWALNLPVLGQEVALVAWQYPAHRNVTLRLLEPLGAREEGEAWAADRAEAPVAAAPPVEAPGVAIAFDDVSVRVAGHTILQGIELRIEAGTHVAIVGPSGAGKSSLVGLLLGWHRPATGRVRADGGPLDGPGLERLRRQTAWVDPMVQLWNRSLLDNLVYGAPDGASRPLSQILEDADLRDLLHSLPDGLQATLGEGGALVSGGEGQRVRFGRAMIRGAARLAILDEPFRGLDRERRRRLLARAREVWREATLLCITHDVGETGAFDRVLVVEGGRIVEDAAPAELAERVGSRYRAMLDAERAVREGLWSGTAWRRLRLEGGRLMEEGHTVGRA